MFLQKLFVTGGHDSTEFGHKCFWIGIAYDDDFY